MQYLHCEKTMIFDVDAALSSDNSSIAADVGDGGANAWARDITNGIKPLHWMTPILVRNDRVGIVSVYRLPKPSA